MIEFLQLIIIEDPATRATVFVAAVAVLHDLFRIARLVEHFHACHIGARKEVRLVLEIFDERILGERRIAHAERRFAVERENAVGGDVEQAVRFCIDLVDVISAELFLQAQIIIATVEDLAVFAQELDGAPELCHLVARARERVSF